MDLIERGASTSATVSFGSSRSLETWTVSQLWNDAKRASKVLPGLTDADSVGMVLAPSPQSVSVLLGAWIAGFRVVSIPPLAFGASPSRRLPGILKSEDLDLVVSAPPNHDSERSILGRTIAAEAVVAGQVRSKPRSGPGALVHYTSGSIGDPSGVELTLDAIAANVTSVLEVIDPSASDRALSWLPLHHDMGLIGMLLASFVGFGSQYAGGGHFTLLEPESYLRDPRVWLRRCSEERVTITAGPNAAYELAARFASGPLDLSSMRVALVGAEPVRVSTLERFGRRFAGHGLGPTVLCPAYGLAEAALAVTMSEPTEPWRRARIPGAAPDDDGTVVGCGRPISGMRVRAPEIDDRLGPIMLDGPSMLTRYVGGREVPRDPAGWFVTGDLGFSCEGELFVVGRADDVLVVRGENFYPADIEDAVGVGLDVPASTVAAVRAPGGYAIIIEQRGGLRRIDPVEIARQARVAVAEAFPAPSAVNVVASGEIPRTSSGKTRRAELRQNLA